MLADLTALKQILPSAAPSLGTGWSDSAGSGDGLIQGAALKRRPTIKDVAQEARVSHATVSYVLTNSPHADRISEETKKRVWEAVRKLGYRSNPIGRALKRGYTAQVTLLIVTWNLARSHSATAMAVSRAAIAHDLQCIVHVADSDYDAELFLRHSNPHNMGGILVLWDSPALMTSCLKDLAAEGLPVIDLLPDSPPGISTVTADREDAGYKVTRHLIEIGHRQIGVICDTTSRAKTSLRKLAGYRRALEEAGLEYDESLIENVTEFGFDGGYLGFARLVERHPDVTAVFCINDPMALGALVAASEQGRSCPSDISVVGYGDAPEACYWRPRLTTVSLSAEQVASRAIEMIIEKRRSGDMNAETVLVPGELIVRDSTAPPRR
ncbi:MAG: LacI family DNA-binding transcriptional regulator [Armatimonadota bacterium]|nr:LacI family DNA-binding transcriptional regulator [Armatimonadota bacterium]